MNIYENIGDTTPTIPTSGKRDGLPLSNLDGRWVAIAGFGWIWTEDGLSLPDLDGGWFAATESGKGRD